MTSEEVLLLRGQIMGSDGTIYATPEAYQASLKPELGG